uniref:Uncharacterized protein n=1 Tax=Setaria viridis TaxID=4556 RepID=A0A4U6WCJ3_SETVI|nr:hypothetical protein SEVIR_1G189600v2 [Setaria viridis]
MEQVVAIWVDGNDPQHRFSRSIIIYGKSDEPHYIRAYHGCYDPLTYPLFFPHGETGWEDKKIEFQDPPQSQLKRKYTKHKRQDALVVDGNKGAINDHTGAPARTKRVAQESHIDDASNNEEEHNYDDDQDNDNEDEGIYGDVEGLVKH